MSKVCVEESEMKFGPFDEEVVFHIEKCEQYLRINENMKMVEMLLLRNNNKLLLSIEAKKSAPNPTSKNRSNPQERFDEFIDEIHEKFVNSLDLILNLFLTGVAVGEFANINFRELEITFVLVVKEHKPEWITSLRDALNLKIRQTVRTHNIWKCGLMVFNESMAIHKGLIIEETNYTSH